MSGTPRAIPNAPRAKRRGWPAYATRRRASRENDATPSVLDAEGTSAWARDLIERATETAADSLRRFCRQPRSAKRLHKARKCLARLLAGLDDLGDAAGMDGQLRVRVRDVRRRAGKVRDADVLLRRVKAYRKLATGTECDELRAIVHKLRKRRKKARRRLQSLIAQLPVLRA